VFDGCGFPPHRILQYFFVTLKGKIVSIDIEVVDAHLDNNCLLGRSWFYAMIISAYSVFHIFIVDQLDYTTPDLHSDTMNNVSFLGHNRFESVELGLFKDSSLMGVILLPTPPTLHVSR
jgi:hypothetical protein